MRVFIGLVSIAVICSIAACKSRGKAVPATSSSIMKPQAKAGPAVGESVTLEAENFTLTAVKAVSLAGASGGKAIHFMESSGEASTSTLLAKGTYEVMLYLQGTDQEHDAVYLTVAETEFRFFPGIHGEVTQAGTRGGESVLVEIASDGDHPVRLAYAEDDVCVDRVVLKRVK